MQIIEKGTRSYKDEPRKIRKLICITAAMKSRMDNAEERISDLEDRIMEITQLE